MSVFLIVSLHIRLSHVRIPWSWLYTFVFHMSVFPDRILYICLIHIMYIPWSGLYTFVWFICNPWTGLYTFVWFTSIPWSGLYTFVWFICIPWSGLYTFIWFISIPWSGLYRLVWFIGVTWSGLYTFVLQCTLIGTLIQHPWARAHRAPAVTPRLFWSFPRDYALFLEGLSWIHNHRWQRRQSRTSSPCKICHPPATDPSSDSSPD